MKNLPVIFYSLIIIGLKKSKATLLFEHELGCNDFYFQMKKHGFVFCRENNPKPVSTQFIFTFIEEHNKSLV